MCLRMHFLDLQRLYVVWTAGLTTAVSRLHSVASRLALGACGELVV